MFTYNPEPSTLVLSVPEVAEQLQISESTAYQLLRNGKLNGFKIGTVWKIPYKSLNNFIQENSQLQK